MSTIRPSRVLVAVMLTVSAALTTQAQARPSDPQWNPAAQAIGSDAASCGPIAKRVAYGPRPLDVILGHEAHQSVAAQATGPMVGPRGTIVLKGPRIVEAGNPSNIC